MAPVIGASSQGESRLAFVRVVRRGDRHDPRALTISVRYEGDFSPAFLDGRPEGVIPREPLKALVHAAARSVPGAELEPLGLAIVSRLLAAHPQMRRTRVELIEQPWTRIEVGGKPHGQAFLLGGPEQPYAAVTSNGAQTAVVSGIDGLVLMRTAGFLSARSGARAEDGTEDAVQPMLVGTCSVRWTYSTPDVTFRAYRQGVRAAVVETLAADAGRSVHHMLYRVADAVLAAHDEILDVTLSFAERPCRPAEPMRLEPSGTDELFSIAESPVGQLDVKVERSRSAV